MVKAEEYHRREYLTEAFCDLALRFCYYSRLRKILFSDNFAVFEFLKKKEVNRTKKKKLESFFRS